MKRIWAAAIAAALTGSGAFAGGIDRSGQSIAALFEPGNYAEFSFGSIDPTVSGVQLIPIGFSPPGSLSGDMSDQYAVFGSAIKMQMTESFDVALIFDQPFGAKVTYPSGTSYFATGSVAGLTSNAVTGLARYRFSKNFSVHSGVRFQSLSATAAVPFVSGYNATAANDNSVGYLVGAAYERPEIAMRVALTYNSAIKHQVVTTENSLALGTNTSPTTIETPQSVNLEMQTGIAKDTLLFGSVRWVNWSEFVVSPADYFTLTGGVPLVSFSDDTISYSLGVGRRFNENWSGAVTLGHEAQTGGLKSNLAPTDGYTSVGVGVTYTHENMKISSAVRQIWVGDATTSLFGLGAANFSGNTATVFGMKVSFTF